MNKSLLLAPLVASFLLASCASNTSNQNMTAGAVTGGVIGGLAGTLVGGPAKAVAIGAGVVAGALIGGYIGKNMDSTDNSQLSYALANTPSRKTTTWTNTRTGAVYTFTPTSNVMVYKGNRYCRRYHMSVEMNGRVEHTRGIACMGSNNVWQTVR